MKINPISRHLSEKKTPYKKTFVQNFCKKDTRQKPVHEADNPINKRMEQLDLLKATVIAGLGFGVRAVAEIADENPDFLEGLFSVGERFANKNYTSVTNKNLKFGLSVASAAAIVIGTIGTIAGIYAVCNAPKAMYQGEVNAHKKSEEMDVYIKGNEVEKDLYKQVGDRAKEVSTLEEQNHVKQQYALLRAAKNQIPGFVTL